MKSTLSLPLIIKKKIFSLRNKSQFFVILRLCKENTRKDIYKCIQLSVKHYKILRFITGEYRTITCFDGKGEGENYFLVHDYLLVHVTLDRECRLRTIYPEPNTELANLCMGDIKVHASIDKTDLILETMAALCTNFSVDYIVS